MKKLSQEELVNKALKILESLSKEQKLLVVGIVEGTICPHCYKPLPKKSL